MSTDRELLELANRHEQAARRVAHIMGPASAAAQALAAVEASREAGVPACVMLDGRGSRSAWRVVKSAAKAELSTARQEKQEQKGESRGE